MSTLLWPVLAGIAAVLQVCTGLLRDASGLASLDLLLILVMGAAVWRGPWLGLVCGLLGGLVEGAPGGTSVEMAVIYGLCGGLAGIASRQTLLRAVLLVACVGAGTALVLAAVQTAPAHLDILSYLPLAGRTTIVASLIVLSARSAGPVPEN